MKRKLLCCLVLLMNGLIYSNTVKTSNSSNAYSAPRQLFASLWGTPSPSSAKFYPAGFHFNSKNSNNLNWLTALSLHGFMGGTFVNSFNQRVYVIGVERNIFERNKFSINYALFIMHGYGENSKKLGKSFFNHDPGPGITLSANWLVTKHLSFNILTYGGGAILGMSYNF